MKTRALLSLLLFAFGTILHTTAAETFDVAGLKFDSPEKWKSVQPTSSMRKAQFSVVGKDGAAEVVFFHFGPGQGGGVQANVDRWLGQFAEPKEQLNATTEKKSVDGIEITYVSAEGTYMSGPPFGQKKPMKDHALLGAIVINESGGDVFIKMTGPNSLVSGAIKTFKAMVESVKK